MERENLRGVFQKCPRFLLVLLVATLGLVFHLSVGFFDGLKDWVEELKDIWRIDEESKV